MYKLVVVGRKWLILVFDHVEIHVYVRGYTRYYNVWLIGDNWCDDVINSLVLVLRVFMVSHFVSVV